MPSGDDPGYRKPLGLARALVGLAAALIFPLCALEAFVLDMMSGIPMGGGNHAYAPFLAAALPASILGLFAAIGLWSRTQPAVVSSAATGAVAIGYGAWWLRYAEPRRSGGDPYYMTQDLGLVPLVVGLVLVVLAAALWVHRRRHAPPPLPRARVVARD